MASADPFLTKQSILGLADRVLLSPPPQTFNLTVFWQNIIAGNSTSCTLNTSNTTNFIKAVSNDKGIDYISTGRLIQILFFNNYQNSSDGYSNKYLVGLMAVDKIDSNLVFTGVANPTYRFSSAHISSADDTLKIASFSVSLLYLKISGKLKCTCMRLI